jgi:hypothetical protein
MRIARLLPFFRSFTEVLLISISLIDPRATSGCRYDAVTHYLCIRVFYSSSSSSLIPELHRRVPRFLIKGLRYSWCSLHVCSSHSNCRYSGLTLICPENMLSGLASRDRILSAISYSRMNLENVGERAHVSSRFQPEWKMRQV